MPKIFDLDQRKALKNDFLTKGHQIFGRLGLNRTTVEDLTKAVGLGKGTFYNFFPSKEDLFFEIFFLAQQEVWKEVKNLGESLLKTEGLNSYQFLSDLLEHSFTLQSRDLILSQVLDPEENKIFVRALTPARQAIFDSQDLSYAKEVQDLCHRGGFELKIETKLLAGVIKTLFLIHLNTL